MTPIRTFAVSCSLSCILCGTSVLKAQQAVPQFGEPIQVRVGDQKLDTELEGGAKPFLYDFNADGVEDLLVGGKQFKAAGGMVSPGMGDALLAQVDADDAAAQFQEFAAGVAVAASDIENACAGTNRTGQGHHFGHEMTVHVGGVGVEEAEVAVAIKTHQNLYAELKKRRSLSSRNSIQNLGNTLSKSRGRKTFRS